MSFTDDDLKQLKEWNEVLPKPIIVGLEQGDEFHEFDLSALITRLEAAEDCLTFCADCHCGNEPFKDGCACGYTQRFEVWRRAAGKIKADEADTGSGGGL